MKILLDTHILLYILNGQKNESIDKRVIDTLDNSKNHKYVSVVSLWEIAIKINIGKLRIKRDFDFLYELLASLKIEILQLRQADLKTYLSLPLIHRDPFDRIIISQAISQDLYLITDDSNIKSF